MSFTYIDADEAIAIARASAMACPLGFDALHKQEHGRTIPDMAVDEFSPADRYP